MEKQFYFGHFNKVRTNESLWQWWKNSRQSELVIVMGEDIAALLGLALALISVILSVINGNPVFDAVGTIGIGVLLVFISLFQAVKIESLLIGQSVSEQVRYEITQLIEDQPEVESVINLITLQLGPQIMVAVKGIMVETGSVNQLVDNINRCEAELKKMNSAIKWAFFEPDVR